MKKSLFLLLSISLLVAQCSKDKRNYENYSGNYDHSRSVGASAGDMLKGTVYSSVKIELQYMPGFQPDAAAVDHLVNMLTARLNKPAGITVVQKQVASIGKTSASVSDITSFEKMNRTVFTKEAELGIYFLFTDGDYTDTNVLGIAYRNTSMCIFGKTIHDHSGDIGQASRTKLTATVLEHEFGHILGLVDVGTPMQTPHKDANHGNHCNNSNCLMYYASETTDILGFLVTGNIPAPDANCIGDLQGNGGK